MVKEALSLHVRTNAAIKVCLGVMVIFCATEAGQAGGWESREFAISIDGRSAGKFRLDIRSQADGSIDVQAHANVLLNYLVYRYTYKFDGIEQWRNGRLMGLKSSSNDNGKKFQTEALAQDSELRVVVNGIGSTYRADVWTTTYWKLPDPRYRNAGVPLLDADTGKYLDGSLKFVKRESVIVAGVAQPCDHYRVTAPGIDADVWYDANERLVRQTTLEDGHRTVLLLTTLQRR